MQPEIQQYPFGARPDVTRPNPEFLTFMGEDGIRKLVNRHYNLMSESSIAHLFPTDKAEFEAAKKRSADFFIQICGGPDYFNQNRGKPALIRRHAPFAIDAAGRQVWLECYHQALLEFDIPKHLFNSFWNYIQVFSAWMINSKKAEE
ncbi:MAG: globin [Paludibacteraceae bacterium]|nr:globin [Paludibacteraceae bacterium]